MQAGKAEKALAVLDQRPVLLAIGGAVLPLLAVYLLSGPQTLPEADAGEFAAIAFQGGIAHPPGYPLYGLLLQAFALLSPPLGPVRALSLLSMLLGCTAAALLCMALMRRGATAFAAWAATVVVFLSCNVWRASTAIEPFALNLLLGAAVIACSVEMVLPPPQGERLVWPLGVGFLFGLGFCNHHSLAMMAPLPLAVMLYRPRRLGRCLAAAGGGFLLGLWPLALFWLWRDSEGWVWGQWSPFWPRLLQHLFRAEYGTLNMAPSAQGSWIYGPLRFLSNLPAVLSVAFLLVAVAGLLWAARQQLREDSNAVRDGFGTGAVLSFLTTGLLFPALFRLEGTELDDLIADRFFALPVLLLAFPLAVALGSKRVSRSARWRLAVTVLLFFHLSHQWDRAERQSHRFFEQHLQNLLQIAEPNAVIMTLGDDGFAGGLYARYVWGHREVSFVLASLESDWYRRRVGVTLEFDPGGAGGVRRPLYLLDVPETASSQVLRLAPKGPLLRVLLAGEQMPSAQQLYQENRQLFAGLRLPSGGGVEQLDAWEADILRYYARTWDIIGRRLEQAGDRQLARLAFAFRGALSPSATAGNMKP